MLTKREHETKEKRNEITYISTEEMVPQDHIIRKIDSVMNWEWLYEKVEHLYSEHQGRPSIDPIVLVKISMLQLIFGIESMRQTLTELQTNLAYRWFIGYGLHDSLPHHSTVGKNFLHRFEENQIAEEIFSYVLKQCLDNGLVETDAYFIDSTHIKANANKHKLEEKEEVVPPRPYHEVLKESVDALREKHGKKPLKKKNKCKKRK